MSKMKRKSDSRKLKIEINEPKRGLMCCMVSDISGFIPFDRLKK